MKKYTILIEETVVENFELEANSFNDAIDIAMQKYDNGEFSLEPGELHYARLTAVTQGQDIATAKWLEL